MTLLNGSSIDERNFTSIGDNYYIYNDVLGRKWDNSSTKSDKHLHVARLPSALTTRYIGVEMRYEVIKEVQIFQYPSE